MSGDRNEHLLPEIVMKKWCEVSHSRKEKVEIIYQVNSNHLMEISLSQKIIRIPLLSKYTYETNRYENSSSSLHSLHMYFVLTNPIFKILPSMFSHFGFV
jgi:hypothetical protein